jgi:hypothetical protein
LSRSACAALHPCGDSHAASNVAVAGSSR